MREIKVKAWDGEKFYTPILYGGLVYRSFRDFEDGISTDDKVIQYVGFKDKYGREIYEGYIDEYGYVVTYLANLKDGLGMNAGWYLQRDNFESWSELECNEDIEIIGDIFKTPDKAINNCNTDYTKII